jgi:hypothetical protein
MHLLINYLYNSYFFSDLIGPPIVWKVHYFHFLMINFFIMIKNYFLTNINLESINILNYLKYYFVYNGLKVGWLFLIN